MNTKQFLERITHNWKAKVICFVIAIFVYFIHQMSLLSKKTFTLPLSVEQNGSMLPAESFEKFHYVRVTVRGKTEQLASLTESDFTALIDISYKDKEGTYTFPVIIQPSERTMLMEPLEIRVKPEKVPLAIEQKSFKFAKVVPSVAGKVAHGYELVATTSEPHSIKVEGPRSIVEQVTEVYTDAVDVEGLTKDTTRIVKVINKNLHVSLANDAPVRIKVSVRPVGMTKSFQNIPISFTNLKENFSISASKEPLNVVLEGDQLVLENLNVSQIKADADCSSITEAGEYNLPVNVLLPARTSLTSQSMDAIMVKVEEIPLEEIPLEEVPATDDEGEAEADFSSEEGAVQ